LATPVVEPCPAAVAAVAFAFFMLQQTTTMTKTMITPMIGPMMAPMFTEPEPTETEVSLVVVVEVVL